MARALFGRRPRPSPRGAGRGGGRFILVNGLALVGLVLVPGWAPAQLEILLRNLPASKPRPGACGQYRFRAEEPEGKRALVFHTCVEQPSRRPGESVWLAFRSGDSLEARVEVAPAWFEGRGGELLDQIRSVVEVAHGDTSRLQGHELADVPGLARATALPAVEDSSLGSRELIVGGRPLRCSGRRLRESSRAVRSLSGVEMIQSEARCTEIWTAAEAPILGLVRAVADIRSERRLARSVPGVPERGPRLLHYELELLSIEAAPRPGRAR